MCDTTTRGIALRSATRGVYHTNTYQGLFKISRGITHGHGCKNGVKIELYCMLRKAP